MDDSNLYLSNYIREIAVPFSNIDEVQYFIGIRSGDSISITFRQPTEFGKKISFFVTTSKAANEITALLRNKANRPFISHSDVGVHDGKRMLISVIFWDGLLALYGLGEKLPAPFPWAFTIVFFIILPLALLIWPEWSILIFAPMHILSLFFTLLQSCIHLLSLCS